MTEVAGGLTGLAKLGRPVPAETELDRFAAYVASGAIIAHASAFHVCAERGDSERAYKPDGGLTEAVYRLAGNDDERAILARGVLEGELVRQGHEYRAVRAALGRYECDDLRDLVEGHSFGAVADAFGLLLAETTARTGPRRAVRRTYRKPPTAQGSMGEDGISFLATRIGEILLEVGRRAGPRFGGGPGVTGEAGLLTEDEAIAYLRLDTIDIADRRATLRRYREAGQLRGTQVSKRVFYLREELDAFLKRATQDNPR